jgi:hypothetical protein
MTWQCISIVPTQCVLIGAFFAYLLGVLFLLRKIPNQYGPCTYYSWDKAVIALARGSGSIAPVE